MSAESRRRARQLSAWVACRKVVGKSHVFWDDFSNDGQLGPEAAERKVIGSLCLQREITPGSEAEYTFLLGWHFPNRTPAWSGWTAPKGHENAIIGNYYCTRFTDAWAAAQHVAQNLPELEKRTMTFVSAMRASTMPGAVRDAAMANLSTLVTQTSFRTADGEFHGFEGCNDQRGCCFGNCTHVWNYETSTQFLFPMLARSLRKAAFGFSQDEQGGMRLSADATGRDRPFRIRRGGRPDGPDHQDLSGLAAVRRYRMAAELWPSSSCDSHSPGYPAVGMPTAMA